MKSYGNGRKVKEQIEEERERIEKYQKESAIRTGELKREYEAYIHRSKWWFLLPVVFALIGGISMFLEHAGTNPTAAKIGLLSGIVVSASILCASLHFRRG